MRLDFSLGTDFGEMVTTPHDILHRIFGFQGFRGVQEEVIGRVMAGRHTLAVMPTGAGKSLCYQVPALALAGTALVISPLIALMHDQIRAAEGFGFRAAALTSADSNRAETIERLRQGALDLLYVAPERATGAGFRDLIARIPLEDAAISTSGDYERYFDENGVRYHHIIDPGSGRSASKVRSATIIGPTATRTDGLSKTAFILGPERALEIYNRLDDIDAILVTPDGRVLYSKGLEAPK